MDTLKQFNSRSKDIVTDESPEMKTGLTQIPDELISLGTIAEHDSEIRIDSLVCQQSSSVDSTNDQATETAIEDMSENPINIRLHFNLFYLFSFSINQK